MDETPSPGPFPDPHSQHRHITMDNVQQSTTEGAQEHHFLNWEQKKGFGIEREMRGETGMSYAMEICNKVSKMQEGSKVTISQKSFSEGVKLKAETVYQTWKKVG